jgi:hypothetical protein
MSAHLITVLYIIQSLPSLQCCKVTTTTMLQEVTTTSRTTNNILIVFGLPKILRSLWQQLCAHWGTERFPDARGVDDRT